MSSTAYLTALEDFRGARRRASLEMVMAAIRGKSADLMSFEQVRQQLRAVEMGGEQLRDIPVAAIVGSVDRYTDFTRSFLPRLDSTSERWARVSSVAQEAGSGLPPIRVYQVGEAYFVVDGNHRVSVARQMNNPTIQAYVTEVKTRVPLTPDTSPEDLIIKSRQVAFLENTHLDEYFPDSDFTTTAAGQYSTLENDIEAHRFFMEMDRGEDVDYPEAVKSWYISRYLPIVDLIRERGLLDEFPDRTATDMYVWLIRHHMYLQRELGWDISPAAAADHLIDEHSNRRSAPRTAERLLDALLPNVQEQPLDEAWQNPGVLSANTDNWLFNLLVPVNGQPESWVALEQALIIAKCANSRLYGLHVVPDTAARESKAAQAVKTEFERRTADCGIFTRLAIEVGNVSQVINRRARWADLVVLRIQHPSTGDRLNWLGSSLRALIQRAPRPILAVPGEPSHLTHALLAFDASDKAYEGLYIAAYLATAERWRIKLTVMAVNTNGKKQAAEWLDKARQYLEKLGVEATYVEYVGDPAEQVVLAAENHNCDLIIMGGISSRGILEVVLGSNIDKVLSSSKVPVLFCR